MSYRENASALPRYREPPSGWRWSPAIVILNTLLILTNIVWVTARIRAQPPERIVRVEVRIPVPGPERRVEVPALPPPRCLDSVSRMDLRDREQILCSNGGMVHVTMSNDVYYATVECHCPRENP